LIVDFKLDGKYVVMVGGGSEAQKKALTFLDAGARVLVVSRNFSSGIKRLHKTKRIQLLRANIRDGETFVNELNPKPDLLAVATSDHELNAALARTAKSKGFMVYVADNPAISDFILPAVAKIGDIRVAISTNGKSPAMAKTLRERIEKLITQEDLLQIKLQDNVRATLKQRIVNQKDRKKIIYRILKDQRVKRLLENGKLDEAQEVAMEIVKSFKVENASRQRSTTAAGKNFQETV
jgi:precorrin-2 dehydrogenase/sirohydrochlorin ferrochelatase